MQRQPTAASRPEQGSSPPKSLTPEERISRLEEAGKANSTYWMTFLMATLFLMVSCLLLYQLHTAIESRELPIAPKLKEWDDKIKDAGEKVTHDQLALKKLQSSQDLLDKRLRALEATAPSHPLTGSLPGRS